MIGKYRVTIHINGCMGLSSYDGYVDVLAHSWDEAAERARAKLKAGTFQNRAAADILATEIRRMDWQL